MDGVNEVAAFAVPASFDGGEDEIMLALVPEPNSSVTHEAIAAHGDQFLPKFAYPRYIEIVTGLPKTPTGKIQKENLRARGVSDGVWDRDTR